MTDTTIKTIPIKGYVGNPENKEFIPDYISYIEGRYSLPLQSYINECKLHINEEIEVGEENWRTALKEELENPEIFDKDSELANTLKTIVEKGNFVSLLQYYNKINSVNSRDIGMRLDFTEVVKINRISDIREAFYSKYMHIFHLNHMPGHIIVGQMNLWYKGLSDFAFTKTFKIKHVPIISGGYRNSSSHLKMNINRALFQNIFSSDKVLNFGVRILRDADRVRAMKYFTPALKAEIEEIEAGLKAYFEDGVIAFTYVNFVDMIGGTEMKWKYSTSTERSAHFDEVKKRMMALYVPQEVTIDEQSAPIEEAVAVTPQAIELTPDDDTPF